MVFSDIAANALCLGQTICSRSMAMINQVIEELRYAMHILCVLSGFLSEESIVQLYGNSWILSPEKSFSFGEYVRLKVLQLMPYDQRLYFDKILCLLRSLWWTEANNVVLPPLSERIRQG
jgi:hypothetical protein